MIGLMSCEDDKVRAKKLTKLCVRHLLMIPNGTWMRMADGHDVTLKVMASMDAASAEMSERHLYGSYVPLSSLVTGAQWVGARAG